MPWSGEGGSSKENVLADEGEEVDWLREQSFYFHSNPPAASGGRDGSAHRSGRFVFSRMRPDFSGEAQTKTPEKEWQ